MLSRRHVSTAAVVAFAGPIEGESPIRHDLEALRIDRSAAPPSRRWPWIVAAAVVVGAVAVASWLVAARKPAVETAVVREHPDGAAAAETVLNASGYVTARRRATVASKITGKLVDVRVEEGVSVEQDQVLARLDDSQYRAALALAEAQLEAARRAVDEYEARLELAQLTLDRTRRLVDDGVAFRADLDRDRTEVAALDARLDLERRRVDVAAREVDLRRTELADTVIRAPFAGVVISKDAQPGEIVSPVSAGGWSTWTRSRSRWT